MADEQHEEQVTGDESGQQKPAEPVAGGSAAAAPSGTVAGQPADESPTPPQTPAAGDTPDSMRRTPGFNPFANEDDMFKVVLAVAGGAVVILLVVVLIDVIF